MGKDKSCWMCDDYNNLSHHHILPKHLNPRRNKVIPLCKSCHKRLERHYFSRAKLRTKILKSYKLKIEKLKLTDEELKEICSIMGEYYEYCQQGKDYKDKVYKIYKKIMDYLYNKEEE